MSHFELNCDLGESVGNDSTIMPYLDACSIACGGHTGDEKSMREAIQLAKKHNVKVGAHPSFPDRIHFGRKVMDISKEHLIDSLFHQIDLLQKVCKEEDMILDHIKPHGALYNLAAKEKEMAEIIIEVMKEYPELALFSPWKSVVAEQAQENKINVRYEGFADRRYTSNLELVNRSLPNSVITNSKEALKQVLSIVNQAKLICIDGSIVPFKAQTFCIHGDNPAAVEIVRHLNQSNRATI